LILRCRQDARARFARLRSDVLVKLELLENKKAQDVAYQLRKFIQGLSVYHNETVEQLKENSTLFPVEVDLSQNAFQYKSTGQIIQDNPDDDEEIEYGKEIQEYHDIEKEPKQINRRQTKDVDSTESSEQLLPGIDTVDLNASDAPDDDRSNLTLLTELGLADTAMPMDNEFGEFQNGLNFAKKNDVDDVFDNLLSGLSMNN
ncbi:hypothetical protein O3G_MSEX000522, partial [Manduca sexta]